jgi:hypothetical protein
MQGTNSFILNEATMLQAMQLYVDKYWTNPPKVTAIKKAASPYYDRFELTLEGQDDKHT